MLFVSRIFYQIILSILLSGCTLFSANSGGRKNTSQTGCVKGLLFYDASLRWPYSEKKLLFVSEKCPDTLEVTTDGDGRYSICGLEPGAYRIWAEDSADITPELVLDSLGNCHRSFLGYSFPSFIKKTVLKLSVTGNDTVDAGATALFYPRSMGVQHGSDSSDSLTGLQFLGRWKTVRMIQVKEGEPDPEGTEVSYPQKLDITLLNDCLSVAYVDQFGRGGIFRSVVDNRGDDVILTNPELKTKHPDSFSIVHHIKISGDTLQGVTFGRVRLFEWQAVRTSERN